MTTSVSSAEINHFSKLSSTWWDETGPFKTLHKINPVRLDFMLTSIDKHFNKASIENMTILDVGCGGGLVCEPLSHLKANITGVDACEENICTARNHAQQMGLNIDYQHTLAEDLVDQGKAYDIVTCMEVVEHVDNRDDFLRTLTHLVRPGGLLLLSTINKTKSAYWLGIVAAENILKWAPKGTHTWEKFISPSDLSFKLEDLGMRPLDAEGITFSLLTRSWGLTSNLDISYCLSACKPGDHS